jgi:Co/Zn/Cd efflux system component
LAPDPIADIGFVAHNVVGADHWRVISNIGVLLAAGAVAATHSPWPDMLVGGVIAALFLKSAIHVIRTSIPSLREA